MPTRTYWYWALLCCRAGRERAQGSAPVLHAASRGSACPESPTPAKASSQPWRSTSAQCTEVQFQQTILHRRQPLFADARISRRARPNVQLSCSDSDAPPPFLAHRASELKKRFCASSSSASSDRSAGRLEYPTSLQKQVKPSLASARAPGKMLGGRLVRNGHRKCARGSGGVSARCPGPAAPWRGPKNAKY